MSINHPSYSNDMGPSAEEIVSRAIRESVHENRTVYLDYCEYVVEILIRDCDGSSESEHIYWGTEGLPDGGDGGEWQIALTVDKD